MKRIWKLFGGQSKPTPLAAETGPILEDRHYYINTYMVNGNTVDVDRVYTFYEDCFAESDYVRLGEIYAQLPGWLANTNQPYWFGLDDDEFWLWASWEPPGLQIAGHVLLQDFAAWDARFHELLEKSGLPFKNE